jgi:hypothetical protein
MREASGDRAEPVGHAFGGDTLQEAVAVQAARPHLRPQGGIGVEQQGMVRRHRPRLSAMVVHYASFPVC